MSIFSSRVFFYIHIDIDFLDVVEKVKFIESWIGSEYWRVYLLKSVVVITLHYFESVVMITIHYGWSSLTLKPSIETSGMLWQLSDAFDTRWKLLYHPNKNPQYWIRTSIFKVNIQYCFWHQLKNVGSSISNIQGQFLISNIYCYWHPLKTAVSSTFNIDLESQYSRSIFIIQYCFWHPFKIVVSSSSNIQGRYSILLLKPAQNCRIIYMLSILKVNLNVKLVWKYENIDFKEKNTPNI